VKRKRALESNPPRNSQLETHPNDEQWGGGRCGSSPLIIRIDFRMPLKLIKEKMRSLLVGLSSTEYCFHVRAGLAIHAVVLRPVFDGTDDDAAGAMRLR